MYKLSISVDDVNPHPQYRLLGTPAEKWFRALNDEFGVKFDLFVPSCWETQYPISDHQTWIDELLSIGFMSINAHGHYHQTSNPKRYGACEFYELNTFDSVTERAKMMFGEWNKVGYLPIGWRSPGWLTSQATCAIIPTQFDYAAVHYEHNQGQVWGRTDFKLFYGHDGIQQENISIHGDDMIMFQSHIYGNHNHNVWNEHNYEQLRLSLTHLFEQYSIQPKLLKECL